jgi:hypothetical protein
MYDAVVQCMNKSMNVSGRIPRSCTFGGMKLASFSELSIEEQGGLLCHMATRLSLYEAYMHRRPARSPYQLKWSAKDFPSS